MGNLIQLKTCGDLHPEIIEELTSQENLPDIADHGTVAQTGNFDEIELECCQLYSFLPALHVLEMPSQKWLVKKIIPECGIVVLYGPSGSGKSFLALNLATKISNGTKWFGYRTERVPVIYIAMEGESGYPARLQAIDMETKIPESHLVFLFSQPFNANSRADIERLASSIISTSGYGCAVIIDTLSQAASGVDENSSQAMSRIISHLKLLQQLVGGVVIVVHHTGKDVSRGMRGHSLVHAAIDAAIEVSLASNNGRNWRLTKSRNEVSNTVHQFSLRKIVLGTDEDGEEISSCVIQEGQIEVSGIRSLSHFQRSLPKHQETARRLLNEVAMSNTTSLTLDEAVSLVASHLDCEKTRQKERAKVSIEGLIAKRVFQLRENQIILEKVLENV